MINYDQKHEQSNNAITAPRTVIVALTVASHVCPSTEYSGVWTMYTAEEIVYAGCALPWCSAGSALP